MKTLERIAPEVGWLPISFVNVYFVGRPGEPWALIDAGLPGSAGQIREPAEARFGAGSRPAAIYLPPGHFALRGAPPARAEDGEGALAISANNRGEIHLLLTDILMPGMNGRELAVQFRQQRPQSPVIFMSGYTDEVIVEHDLLEDGALFIQKPFTPIHLIHYVREALEGKLQT